MATTAKTTGKTTAKKTAKRSTAKTSGKTTGKATAKKTAAKKTGAKKTAAKQPATKPLLEREPVVLLETAGYAVAGVSRDIVRFARRLPEHVETIRDEESLAKLRDRVTADAKRYLSSFEKVVDTKAADGRDAIDVVTKDERVSKVLDQTSSTRSQLKAALTSVTKTGTVAAEAAAKQADTAKSQVKAAASSVAKTGTAATEAAAPQADNAKSQVKAAATSTRKSAETVGDAVSDR